jgi:hypothetical protein
MSSLFNPIKESAGGCMYLDIKVRQIILFACTAKDLGYGSKA